MIRWLLIVAGLGASITEVGAAPACGGLLSRRNVLWVTPVGARCDWPVKAKAFELVCYRHPRGLSGVFIRVKDQLYPLNGEAREMAPEMGIDPGAIDAIELRDPERVGSPSYRWIDAGLAICGGGGTNESD